MTRLLALVAALSIGTLTMAQTFTAVIDNAQSFADVELCLSGVCDTDSTPLSGSITLDLQGSNLGLRDFAISADQGLTLNLSYGIFGSFNTTLADFALSDATPGTLKGPVPIVADAFSFANVDANSAGTLAYVATGLPCTVLSGAGLACSDTIDLTDGNPRTVDQIAGMISVVGTDVTVTASITTTVPLDPANPGLGTVTVSGQVVATGALLCAGDLTGDSAVDFADFSQLASCFDQPCGDLTGDATTDFADFAVLASDWNCGL